MDTEQENLRQLFLDFIDTASDEVDERAWKDKLTVLDDLLAEVERLQKELEESKENFTLFRDLVAIPALQHAHKQLNERDGDNPTIMWVVDLAQCDDYSIQDAEFFYTEEEAQRFVDAISAPNANYNNMVVTDCYEVTKSQISKSAYHALHQQKYDN